MIEPPKDGTMVCLLVDYAGSGYRSLDDKNIGWTIGFNTLENTGDDEWIMVGWDPSYDRYEQGHGKIIGWAPFAPTIQQFSPYCGGPMKDPNPINMSTPDDVRDAGWQAESRDADGHLISTHAPFEDDDDEGIVWFVRQAMARGNTVTIWPPRQSN